MLKLTTSYNGPFSTASVRRRKREFLTKKKSFSISSASPDAANVNFQRSEIFRPNHKTFDKHHDKKIEERSIPDNHYRSTDRL